MYRAIIIIILQSGTTLFSETECVYMHTHRDGVDSSTVLVMGIYYNKINDTISLGTIHMHA